MRFCDIKFFDPHDLSLSTSTMFQQWSYTLPGLTLQPIFTRAVRTLEICHRKHATLEMLPCGVVASLSRRAKRVRARGQAKQRLATYTSAEQPNDNQIVVKFVQLFN